MKNLFSIFLAIVLFFLIFSNLYAGGQSESKRLPIEGYPNLYKEVDDFDNSSIIRGRANSELYFYIGKVLNIGGKATVPNFFFKPTIVITRLSGMVIYVEYTSPDSWIFLESIACQNPVTKDLIRLNLEDPKRSLGKEIIGSRTYNIVIEKASSVLSAGGVEEFIKLFSDMTNNNLNATFRVYGSDAYREYVMKPNTAKVYLELFEYFKGLDNKIYDF